MMPDIANPNDAILQSINDKAKNSGDNFRVRVMRKSTPGLMPDGICTLDGASVVHLAMPETWLPRLCGGGPIYQFQVFHAEDTTRAIPGYLMYQIPGEPKAVDYDALRSPAWQGPPK